MYTHIYVYVRIDYVYVYVRIDNVCMCVNVFVRFDLLCSIYHTLMTNVEQSCQKVFKSC